MTLIAYVLPKLRTANYVVRQMSKKTRIRTPFDTEHAKGFQTQLKSAGSTFIIFSHNSEGKRFGKCLLVISEILRLIVNILTADYMYSLCIGWICSNQLKCNYLRNKTISLNFSLHFRNFHLNLSILKKEDSHCLWISEITDSQRRN